MKISKQNLANIRYDAKNVVLLIDFLNTDNEKQLRKIQKVFKGIEEMLPDTTGVSPKRASIDEMMSSSWLKRVFDGNMMFIKQKVMRKVEKKWTNAGTKLCNLTRERQRDQWNGRFVGEWMQDVMMRMVWLNHWMIDEITRQVVENDSELDELWEEQKAEEGL